MRARRAKVPAAEAANVCAILARIGVCSAISLKMHIQKPNAILRTTGTTVASDSLEHQNSNNFRR